MVKMGEREFVYPNFGYRSIWLRNRDPVYVFLPHNFFLSGFAILISRTPHQLISIDMK